MPFIFDTVIHVDVIHIFYISFCWNIVNVYFDLGK